MLGSLTILVLGLVLRPTALDGNDASIDRSFTNEVLPFLKTNCLACHNATKQEGKLDLSVYNSTESVVKAHKTWEIVLDRLEAADMPPEQAFIQPTEAERKQVIDWIKVLRDREAKRNAGDPGPVLARRLSNAEYDYTIRDLIGVDIKPTREFPIDPANEAGFDNSGESLTISPALVKKYMAAARNIADHLVLKPNGIAFAPHPVVSDSDRDKYCVNRIVDFYTRHNVDYADYLVALWDYRHPVEARLSLTEVAGKNRLSPKYLRTLDDVLNGQDNHEGPLGEVIKAWKSIPAQSNEIRKSCVEIRDLIARLRKPLKPTIARLQVKGVSAGSQPVVLWKNRQGAERRMSSPAESDSANLKLFCRTFPDNFVVTARPGYFDTKAETSGRLLTAGFHLMQGFFRDDIPLCELVLDDAQRKEIDDLWTELDFVALAPIRQFKDFIFFERAEPPQFIKTTEFDFARSEDKDAVSPAKIARLQNVYLAKLSQIATPEMTCQTFEQYFEDMSAQIRKVEQSRLDAEPKHLKDLHKLAQKAFRRPLDEREESELLAFYRQIREEESLTHEEALRDTVASLFMSPSFLYHYDTTGLQEGVQPLSNYAIANRLSYFLWSSMPDDELLGRAGAGDLQRPEVLAAQAHRMLKDEKVRGLALEFAGNWLDFRRFEEHNGVDRERFPAFTNEIRKDMFEEPIHFFIDLAKNDRSILSLMNSDHTFVNARLANYYGIPFGNHASEEWIRVDGVQQFGRGGFLPMAAFLTANSPGLRTSPVKRGYWVVKRMLGENIPPPPPTVPELPKDEAATGNLSLPELLSRHRDNKACSGCHQRFDSIGLAFEGYGPVGERRQKDFGDRPILAKATFPNSKEGEGLDGLRKYLIENRQDDFIDNFCRKMLAYGLGRTLLLSDESTIEAMKQKLSSNNYAFGSMIETIVMSPQFRNRRGNDDSR